MWDRGDPYSDEELREMRRLIVASGADIPEWVQRTRRSADFVRSLSPEQAEVITLQALAVAAAPEDLGSERELDAARAMFLAIEPGERHKRLWRMLLDIRHRHYPRTE